jgi:pimeloyl-ACP methyl ester carboxylesterase
MTSKVVQALRGRPVGEFLFVAMLAALMSACAREDPVVAAERELACAGPPIKTIEDRQAAFEQGYAINRRFDCIDRHSYETVQRQNAANEQARKEREEREEREARSAMQAVRSGPALSVAREGFVTAVAMPASGAPLPAPPPELFVRSDYRNPQGRMLAAYVTPDPRDGEKHPAIVWLTGGDSNSLDDFWTEGAPANDQSASAYRKAGIVMMFPTLRGGNTDTGRKEFMFGEVDDVVAAAGHLAGLPYVDAQHVYLGGHSTGGTLALLTAEASTRFNAVFAFGALSRVDRYPLSLAPDFGALDLRESRLRSPIDWLDGITTPTWLIEGAEAPGNHEALDDMCEHTRNAAVHCISVPGFNHFSVLGNVSRVIAARLAVASTGVEFSLRQQDFRRADSN